MCGGGLAPPRGAKVEVLSASLAAINVNAWYNDEFIAAAYQRAKMMAKASDRIVIFGSFYTVAQCAESFDKEF